MDGQKLFWERQRKRRNPDHPVVEAFAAPKLAAIRATIRLDEGTTVLDVGCGNGFFTCPLSRIARTTGIDFSQQMLSLNPCRSLVQGSALALPFAAASFEVVFCSNLLHHLDDPRDAVIEMCRVSSRYVILSEPNRNNPLMALFTAAVPEERGALKFSLNYLKRLAVASGLTVLKSCSMGLILPNKTPLSLLRPLRMIDRTTPLGFYSLVICEKTTEDSCQGAP